MFAKVNKSVSEPFLTNAFALFSFLIEYRLLDFQFVPLIQGGKQPPESLWLRAN